MVQCIQDVIPVLWFNLNGAQRCGESFNSVWVIRLHTPCVLVWLQGETSSVTEGSVKLVYDGWKIDIKIYIIKKSCQCFSLLCCDDVINLPDCCSTTVSCQDGDILASSFPVDTQVAYILSLGVVKEFRKHGIGKRWNKHMPHKVALSYSELHLWNPLA